MTGRRIAVIGGGVSGITAGYVLSRTDHVTLFEADGRLGGHADTHLVVPPAGPPAGVDTGFIVYMDRGLRRYTGHPNYFGDFCMWWGLSGISLGSWAELPTIVGPLLMTWVLTRGTGASLTHRRMAASRPQYANYIARTSGFIPLPPRRP